MRIRPTRAAGMAMALAVTAAWAGATSAEATPVDPGTAATFAVSTVSGVAADDVWAVGKRTVDHSSRAEIQHWDGHSWQQASVQFPGVDYELVGVDAVAADDVWAVGNFSVDGFETFAPLVEHWNGSTWTAIPAPNPEGAMGSFYGVAGTSTTDVWAVGTQYTRGMQFALTEHWDGTTWSIVSSPPDAGALYSVSAVTPNEAWAVGNYALEHWDGSSWQRISTYPAVIIGVTAISANDVWVVGWKGHHTYATHWDGTSWSEESPSAPAVGRTQLFAVSGSSSGDVWAVGTRRHEGVFRTLTEHWDGHAWTAVRAPTGIEASEFRGVLALTPGESWAVGHAGNRGLAAHWDGTSWSRVPIG